MQNRLARNACISFWLCAYLAVAILSAGCAAPPPARTDSFLTPTIEEIDVSILSSNASVETVTNILSETLIATQNANLPIDSLGDLPNARLKFYSGEPVTNGDALKKPIHVDISDAALVEGLIPHLIGRVGVSCVETAGQAFWIIDKAAIRSLLDDLDPSSELWASVASCGEECQDCGCIGPMGGSTCSVSLKSMKPVLGAPTD